MANPLDTLYRVVCHCDECGTVEAGVLRPIEIRGDVKIQVNCGACGTYLKDAKPELLADIETIKLKLYEAKDKDLETVLLMLRTVYPDYGHTDMHLVDKLAQYRRYSAVYNCLELCVNKQIDSKHIPLFFTPSK